MGKKQIIESLKSNAAALFSDKIELTKANVTLKIENANLQRSVAEARELISKDEQTRVNEVVQEKHALSRKAMNLERIIADCHHYLTVFRIPEYLKQGEEGTYTETEYTLLERLSLLVEIQPKEADLQIKIIDMREANEALGTEIGLLTHGLFEKQKEIESLEIHKDNLKIQCKAQSDIILQANIVLDEFRIPTENGEQNELREVLTLAQRVRYALSMQLPVYNRTASGEFVTKIQNENNFLREEVKRLTYIIDNDTASELERCHKMLDGLVTEKGLDPKLNPLNGGKAITYNLGERLKYLIDFVLRDHKEQRLKLATESGELTDTVNDLSKDLDAITKRNATLENRIGFLENYVNELNMNAVYKLKGVGKWKFLTKCEAFFNKETGDTSEEVEACFALTDSNEYGYITPHQARIKFHRLEYFESFLEGYLRLKK